MTSSELFANELAKISKVSVDVASMHNQNNKSEKLPTPMALLVLLIGLLLFLQSSAPATAGGAKSGREGAKELYYRQIKSDLPPSNIGLTYVVELERDGVSSYVDSRFPFKSGDKLRFRIQSDLDGHLYILLKRGSKGGSALLFPAPGSEEDSRIKRGESTLIPREGVIEFDNNPGIETLKLVLSREKLDKDLDKFSRSILVSPKHGQSASQAACIVDFASADGKQALSKKSENDSFPFPEAVTVVLQDLQKPLIVELDLQHASGSSAGGKLPPGKVNSKAELSSRDTPVNKAIPPRKVTPAQSSDPINDKWALIVGISDFKNPKYNLMYPAKDAKDFADFLVKDGHFAADHVKVLLNEDATRENILTALGTSWLPENAKPGDLVLVYFASHGTSASQDQARKNFLVAYDTNPASAFATGIELQDLARTIKRRINCDRMVIVLDTCHSGSAEPGAKSLFPPLSFQFQDLLQGTGQLVIASAGEEQIAHDSLRYKNGVFTKHFMDGLRVNKKLSDAFAYTQNRVKEECQIDFKHLQEPVLKDGEWKGAEAILLVPPAKPRKAISDKLTAPRPKS